MMIVGGITGGDTQKARKAQVRETYVTAVREMMDVKPAYDAPFIQFDQEERSGPRTPDNDALVITALLVNHKIKRVFIDLGSSTDILFGDAYHQMQLGDVPLESVHTSLYGFVGEVVLPRGDPDKVTKIGSKMKEGVGDQVVSCLRKNKDIFAWTPQDLEGIDPDFRDLNKAYPKNFYPLSRIDQLVDSTSGCELLSMMDASQKYHQIILTPEDHKRVSFITSDDTFYYVAMPFGLKNVGATYERLVDKIFRSQLGRNIEVYVDDMIVKSKKAHHHSIHLKIAEKGLPFFKTLRKIKNFEWIEECQHAFEDLKTYLAKLLLLVKSIPGDTLYLYIYSTSQTVSSVLVREEEGDQTPIYYVCKVLNGVEGRYPPIEKMTLALVITVRKLRLYFLSYPMGIKTNTPLKQVLGQPEASRQLVKWAIELSEYGISYLPRTTIKA
ncbi:UNVERIFIED_CONTAM: Retrovirus-related Pol polyprotein from transposon [Sesamum radiatum]|uniref:Retrovirus-related Pol polyprotein from transposon n=1 Tax=Sesamum radiatum TaxID=300843 RepID=A0AAW2TU46_SESRA